MYCHNCGQQLPEGAKFCVNCGNYVYQGSHVNKSSAPKETPQTNIALTAGELLIRRKKTVLNTEPAYIWLDGRKIKKIDNGETVSIKLPPKQYSVMISQEGIDNLFCQVVIRTGETKTLVYDPSARRSSDAPQTRSNSAAAFGRYGQRTCPRCGGYMTTHMVTESANAGCGTILLYILLACTVLGLLIVIPLMLRKKTETVTYAVCQNCGYQIELSRL